MLPISSRRWVFAVLLAATALPGAANAYDFVLVGGGSDQHLNWRWEWAYPTSSCQVVPKPCGDYASANGIAYELYNTGATNSFFENFQINTGGGIQWTGNDSLKVSATTSDGVRAFAGFQGLGPPGYAESWTAANARDVPMVFQLLADPGDPPTTNLKITPQLVGSVTSTTANGGLTHIQIQYEVTVWVNNVPVTGDTLYGDWQDSGGAVVTRPLALPRGGLNTVMVPNVPISSQIKVRLWAYARMYGEMTGAVQSNGTVTGSGPIAPLGPSLIVLAQPMGVVGVGDAPRTDALELSALPNPSAGATRVHYVLPGATRVRVAVHDVTGRRVATLVDGDQPAGSHDVEWAGLDEAGRPQPAGVYLVRMAAGSVQRTAKIVRLDRGATR